MKNIKKILTPENVYIEYELAGFGSRFVAYIVDYAIQLGLLVGLILTSVLLDVIFIKSNIGFEVNKTDSWTTGIIVAIILVAVFVVRFGYFLFFDMTMNGQSPGKRIVKIGVMLSNGQGISFSASLVRNLMRIVDMIPGVYFLEVLLVILTKDANRIGDFAAGTIVTKVRKATIDDKILSSKSSVAYNDNQKKYRNLEYSEHEAAMCDLGVTKEEFHILKDFMSRKENLGDRLMLFTCHLSNYFVKKFNTEKHGFSNDLSFFEEIIKQNSSKQ